MNDLELLRQAQIDGKTVEEVIAEIEANKVMEERREVVIATIVELLNKVKNKEYDGSEMCVVIAREMIANTNYILVDTTTPVEEEE